MEILSLDGPLGTYDVIYVSPHLDDAVFSCAAHIQKQRQLGKKVLVMSVFTAAQDARKPVKASLEPFLNVEARRDEDREAMLELGVDFHHMNMPEALLRHGGGKWTWGPLEVAWIFVSGLFRAEKTVQDDLVTKLRDVATKTQCPWLIGPAAMGFHPDHLVVHRACCQVTDQVAHLWHYHDFPYCAYPFLTWPRRWALDVRGPLKDVEEELSAEQVATRKRLCAAYQSQIKVCFGSEEKLRATIDKCPNEHFLEVRPEEDDRRVLPLPSIALRSKDTAMEFLNRMLLVDLIISLLALFWVRHGLDWTGTNVHAMRFAYIVIILSAVRVACLFVGKSSITFSWWLCVSSIFLTFAAFSYTAEVRSIALAMYYSLQMWLGCAEQSFANFVKKPKQQTDSEEPLKVLVVSDYMPPQRHGIATHTHGLVTALRENGATVHVYTTTGEADGNTFRVWSMRNPWNPDVRLAIFPSFRLIKTILGGHWDVVHVIFPNFLPWPVMLAAWLVGTPIYASQHCDLERLGKLYVGKFLYNLSQIAYWLVSYLPIYFFATLHSGPTEGYINDHPVMKKFKKERLAVVPSSVDANIFNNTGREEDRRALLQRLNLPEDKVIWLLVARLAPEKDVDELLDALRYYREQWPDEESSPTLVIAGDGPCKAELEAFAAQHKLPVHFLGFLTLPEVARLYRAGDVCVTNSVQETFGLTVIESLASGCPMVMPHCDVFDELYAGSLGDWMYDKGDLHSLAQTLRTASQPSAREHLSALRGSGRLSRSLYWSWREAAKEQAEQYRQAQAMVQARNARFGFWLRIAVIVITLLTLLIVAGVSLASAGSEVHHIINVERSRYLRGGGGVKVA